jgi:TRAP-type C4-dicarboxylate transport system substrate-binding protein
MKKIIFAVLVLLSSTAFGQMTLIKFATLAPEGSTWMNVMNEYDKAIRAESNGRIGFKIYPGGVQGDEKDVLRKIKLGQLHAAGITGNGLTTMAPKARILDAPFLFHNYEEVDHIEQQFDGEFQQSITNGGYVLLGWAEVGFVYIFTNTPVKSPEDIRGVKMWMWEGDPIAEASFKAMGINAIPLSITDVLTSLQTNLIDGVYTSPLAAIALQWFTRVKYMADVPLADASGAVVISKKEFDMLAPDLQQILLKDGQKYLRQLTLQSRKDNTASIETLKKQGITIVEPENKDALSQYAEIGQQARISLVGKLYDQEFLTRVEGSLADFRKAQTGKK